MAHDYATCMAEIGDDKYCRDQFPETAGADDTPTLTPGETITDAQGQQWKVQFSGGKFLRLFNPETGDIKKPTAGGAYQTALGGYIQIDNRGNIIATSSSAPPGFPTGGTGSTARTQFPSEQALDEAQARLAAANAALAELEAQGALPVSPYQQASLDLQKAQLALDKQRAENDLRSLVYQMGMQERSTLIGEKAETGREIMRVGPDPFLQGAYLRGGVQRGTTPQQTAVGQAQAFMQQPLPEVSMDMDVAQLEQALSQMQGQGMQQPQFGTGFGMAQGGTVETGGAFSMKPKMSYLVGEGKHGQGLKAGTAEILTIGNGKVEVTPFGGGAANGGNWAPTGDTTSFLQALSPLYSDFSTSLIPQATVGPGGMRTLGGYGFNAQTQGLFNEMGIQPGLVSFGGPKVYYRDPQTGGYQHVASRDVFEKSGFRWEDVMNFAPGLSQGAFPYGGEMTQPIAPGQIGQETGGFGARSRPLMESNTGALLPAIHKIARQLAQWRAAGDPRYDMALQAYGSALDPTTGLPHGGLSPQYIDAIVNRATPQAGAFGGRRLGFTGGYM